MKNWSIWFDSIKFENGEKHGFLQGWIPTQEANPKVAASKEIQSTFVVVARFRRKEALLKILN